MRVAQLSGSYGTTVGKISDQGAAVATGSISSGGLDEILGHLASSIKRIHGKDDFSSNVAGTFYQSLLPSADDSFDLGSASAAWQDLHLEGDILMTDTGKLATAAGDITLDAANGGSDVVVLGDLTPQADNTYDLGTTALAWKDLNLQGDVLMTDAGKVSTAAGDMTVESAAAGVTLDAATAVKIDSDSGDISFEDGGVAQLAIDMDGTAGEIIIQPQVAGDDLVFKAQGGDELIRFVSEGDVEVKDDLVLKSDSAELVFGAGSDVKLVHTNDVGLHLNAGMRLGFRDQGGEYIYSVEDNILGIVAANEIDLTATDIDINGAVDISGNLVVNGNLDINGSTTTIDTVNMSVQDSIIALGVSGSGGYSASGDRGIIFPRGATGSKTAGFFFNGSDFNLGMSLTGPTSGSFASIANAEYSSLKMGTLKAGADSSYDLGEDGTAFRKLYVDDIDLNGVGRIDLDADADTSIRSPSDDIITFEAAGSDIMSIAETGVKIVDDKALVFGDGNDVVMEYDEDGVDRFMISGAGWRFADDQKLEFGAGGDVTFEYDEDGDDVLQIASANGHVRIGHGADTQLQFRDDAVYINSDADGHLQARADSQISLNINGTDELVLVGSTATFGTNLVVADGALLGNATNADLLTLAAAEVTVKNNSDFTVAKVAGLKLSDGAVTSLAAEINKLDAGTAGSSLALADADAFIVGDATASNETKKALLSDVVTYIQSELTQKVEVAISAAVSPNTDVDLGFGTDADWTDAPAAQKELYLNGQLLVEGANAGANKDFYPGDSAGRVKFEFDLAVGDVIQAILRAG